MTKIVASYPVLLVSLVTGLVIAGADLAGGRSLGRAALSLAIVLGYGLLVTAVGRRSDIVSVLAGRPVDERWEHINLEACAGALGVSGIVVLIVFVIADASGGEWMPYAFMGAVLALSYVGSILVLRLRH